MAHSTAHLARWATQTVWAMEPQAMERYFAVLTRAESEPELAASIREYRAVLLDKGQPLADARGVRVRDGVAVVPVTGPIFRYSDYFTAFSGGATVEALGRNIALALGAPQVQTVVLHVDSPGGEITGIQELASHIAAARGNGKRIVTYGEGMVCSAAYWLASASDYILLGPTAIAGSIGVRQLVDTRTREGRIDMVSSQSPDKLLDATTDEGRAKMQATLDDLAQVFVRDVAQYRGVSVETVLADFGRGGVLVGQAAVTAGLADGMDTLEGVVHTLARQSRRITYYGGSMDTNLQALLDQPVPAASAEPAPASAAASQTDSQLRAENDQLRARIAAIETAQAEQAKTQRTNAIAAAAESHIAAGRFDPEHRTALEGVYGAVYGTPQQVQLDTLFAAVATQPDGEQVTTTPVALDRKAEADYAASAHQQVAAYNKSTGVKQQ